MLVLLKNIVRKSLSAFIAISVLTLNLSGLLQCTSLSMSDDCTQITNKIKPCCVKKMKITFDKRVTKNCSRSMEESQQTADLYIDINRSNLYLTSRAVQYDTTIETGYHPELINKFTSEYSPPVKDLKDSYLINLSLRI